MKRDDIIILCDAYESGYGRGVNNRDYFNPYNKGSDDWEAWDYGYSEGKRKSKKNKPSETLTVSTSERRARRSAERLKAITAKAIEEPVKWAKDRPAVKSCSTCRFVEESSRAPRCMNCKDDYNNFEAKP
jgi:hypothetical protein